MTYKLAYGKFMYHVHIFPPVEFEVGGPNAYGWRTFSWRFPWSKFATWRFPVERNPYLSNPALLQGFVVGPFNVSRMPK
jgi:hypothetical protein